MRCGKGDRAKPEYGSSVVPIDLRFDIRNPNSSFNIVKSSKESTSNSYLPITHLQLLSTRLNTVRTVNSINEDSFHCPFKSMSHSMFARIHLQVSRLTFQAKETHREQSSPLMKDSRQNQHGTQHQPGSHETRFYLLHRANCVSCQRNLQYHVLMVTYSAGSVL